MSESGHFAAAHGRRANAVRIYDYLLGGTDNYEADRAAAKRLLELVPDTSVATSDSRSKLPTASSISRTWPLRSRLVLRAYPRPFPAPVCTRGR